MNYTIVLKREVPVKEVHRSLIKNTLVETYLTHGGEKAIMIRLETGFTYLGFGETFEEAEKNAVENSKKND